MRIAKSTRELGRKIADFDGKYKGMTQAEGEKAVRWIVDIIAAEMVLNRNSVRKLLTEKAVKKASLYLKRTKQP